SHHRDLVAALGLPSDTFLVGSLGNVRPAKSYDNLIRAASQLCKRHPRLHFVIAGDTKCTLMDSLKSLIEKLDLSGRMHFVGFQADTARYLSGLDVFVLSSESEGFSIATVEAQAAGIPV